MRQGDYVVFYLAIFGNAVNVSYRPFGTEKTDLALLGINIT